MRWVLLAALALGCTFPSGAAAVERLTFTAVADTYVDSGLPGNSFAGATGGWTGGTPEKRIFVRFELSGLDGKPVVGARLRMVSRSASDDGGHVVPVASNAWPEAITWRTQPAIGTEELGSFGPIANNRTYEAPLTAVLPESGAVSFAVTSSSAQGARWAMREAGTGTPQLLVDVEPAADLTPEPTPTPTPAPTSTPTPEPTPTPSPTPTPAYGVSTVAPTGDGSSDPTYYSSNHRVALTQGGRTLVVHGRHGAGVQMRWRDGGGSWSTLSTGAVSDGMLLSGTGTGDWAASIAVAQTATGAEVAYAVFSKPNNSFSLVPVYIRRISELDSPDGPRIGPLVTVDAPAGGTYRPDVQVERTAGGDRVAVLWGRKSDLGAFELVTGWITDLTTDEPAVQAQTVLATYTNSSLWGTLEGGAAMRALARVSGRLTAFGHEPSAALTSWWRGPPGLAIGGFPAAAVLDNGVIMSVTERDLTKHIVSVQRFSAAGTPSAVELELTGYATPTIATDGTRAWVILTRMSDGAVVSRSYTPGAGWDATDRLELGAEYGGGYSYPNALRSAAGGLRFVVRTGPPGSDLSGVLFVHAAL